MSSFFFLAFDAATTAIAMDVAVADIAKTPAKDSSNEEAAGGTARAGGLFAVQRTEEAFSSSSSKSFNTFLPQP